MDLIQVGSVVVQGRLLHNARTCIGLKVRLDESSKLPVVVAVHGGKTLIKLPPLPQPSNAAGTPLIYHLAALANARKVQFEGKIEKIENQVATLRLDVLLPEWMLDARHSLPKSQAAAQLLLHLIPLPDIDEDDPNLIFDAEPAEYRTLSFIDALKRMAGVPEEHSTVESGPEVFSLRNCIMSIPTKKEKPPTPEFKHRPEDLVTPSLVDIHVEEAMIEVLKRLDCKSLKSIASTCNYLRLQASEIAPHLKLDLFEHQRDAIRWMLQQEGPPKPIPHPTIRRFSTSNGKILWGNTATGASHVEPPELLFNTRGGFFSDEPGLGKTITSLGLVLRTKGTLPDAPSDAKVTWFVEKKLGFYTINDRDADGLSKLQRAKSTGRERRSTRGQGLLEIENEEDIDEEDAGQAEAEAVGAAAAAGGGGGGAGAAAAGEDDDDDVIYILDSEGNEVAIEKESEDFGAAPVAVVRNPSRTAAMVAAAARKRQRLNEAGASVATGLALRGGGSGEKANEDVDDENMPIDLTTPPPKAPTLAAPSTSGGDSGGGGGRDAAAPAASGEAVNNTNQWGRQVQRLINFTSSEDDEEQEQVYNDDDEELADTEADEEPPDPYIQCDLCSKWRRIPRDLHPADIKDAKWCCYQHPLADWRSCSIPDDDIEATEHLIESPGWTLFDPQNPQSAGEINEDNVDFFRSLLDKYRGKLEFSYGRRPTAPIRHLIKSNPLQIAEKGFAFSGLIANSFGTGFGRFLADIGFIPAPKGTPAGLGLPAQKKIISFRHGDRGDGKYAGDTSQDWLRWMQPGSHFKLVFDQKALERAILEGPKSHQHKIFLSPATLIVVPTELIQHWKDQISKHTEPGALRVAVYDSKSNPSSDFPESPLPQTLAWEYDIIITTFNRMSADWNPHNPLGCSPLAQVHWLRIILDEGHTIGASLTVTSKLQMATSLIAERRWVMTGTPAPSTTPAGTITLKYMQPLLSFLHDQAMGSSTSFSEAIDKQLKDCPVASRWRLQALLKRCLIRASKADSLPPLRRHMKLLDFTSSHAQSYNDFIEIAIRNMLLGDFFDPDHKESFLSSHSVKRATQYLYNLAQACNVSGNINLRISQTELHSCLELLADINAFPPPSGLDEGKPYCGGDHPLRMVEETLDHGGTCSCCNEQYRVILVTPCVCLVCVHCGRKERTKCPHCGIPYVMQSVDDPARKRDVEGDLNPNPKWAVPQQFIELQAAYAQFGAEGESGGAWQGDWTHTDSSKVEYLIRRLRDIQALPPPEWNPNDWGGSTTIWPPPLEDYSEHSSFGNYASGTLQNFYLKNKRKKRAVPKAIIFTQYPIHLTLLVNKIQEPYPTGCVEVFKKTMSYRDKEAALNRFKEDPLCRVLIMDESGSHGLNLFCAQYVFIMEPIENKSLEEQVVSRAHRLGQLEEVHVEILAMRGSYEEAILRRNEEESFEKKEEIDMGEIKVKIEEVDGVEKEIEEDDTGGASGSGSGSGSRTGGASGSGGSGGAYANESKRQFAAKRMDRNAYLRGLAPVRVGNK